MSKHYPSSPRKYDMYLATPGPLDLGRVLFTPDGRSIVILEEYSRDLWEAERALPPANEGPGRLVGVGYMAERLSEILGAAAPSNPTEPVPAEMRFFYGADLV